MLARACVMSTATESKKLGCVRYGHLGTHVYADGVLASTASERLNEDRAFPGVHNAKYSAEAGPLGACRDHRSSRYACKARGNQDDHCALQVPAKSSNTVVPAFCDSYPKTVSRCTCTTAWVSIIPP